MTTERFIEGVKKTGYGLEYITSNHLNNNGWTVINNKYYIDDVQGSAREIDIVAYKVNSENSIQVYTVLIISCKKSTKNSWALLSKDRNDNDPNIDWKPVTVWSNQKILKFMLRNYQWKPGYIKASAHLDKQLFTPEKHIFAFQELNNNNGKPQNDKSIFNSVISAMKSQDYEIESLDKRKKESSIYYFNLVSVVDAPLLRVNYNSSEPEIEEIDSDIYVGNYIVNKREKTSRVHFVNSGIFDEKLKIYNKLHIHNIKQTTKIFDSYFKDCVQDKKKIELYKSNFIFRIRFSVYRLLKEIRDDKILSWSDVNLEIEFDQDMESLKITIKDVLIESEVESFNSNTDITEVFSKALKEIYQYEGNFYFNTDTPF